MLLAIEPYFPSAGRRKGRRLQLREEKNSRNFKLRCALETRRILIGERDSRPTVFVAPYRISDMNLLCGLAVRLNGLEVGADEC